MKIVKRICDWCYSSKWMTVKDNFRYVMMNMNNPLWKCNDCQTKDKTLYDKKWWGFMRKVYRGESLQQYEEHG